MKKKLLLLATSACVLTALVPPSVVFGSSQLSQRQSGTTQIAQGATAFPVNEILRKLKGKTQVPIFIPSRIPVPQKMYYPTTAQANSYSISIEYKRDCGGTTVCTFGSIQGQKGGEFTTKLEGVTKTLKNVKLAGGVKGVFHNGCGAYCTATLEWKTQGFMYTVAIKNGRESDLILIGNSAIQAGKR
ncbi:hypothetical protein [Microcoleus vaginatus]|uniref:hypothetical protein n=1 Tax=Microcoleus vaginatus TaxID=119532 RepID=UPI001685F523|nr:hypothetical protein [Microcoleus sp. FACHB-84]MBD2009711.1 hypothetical protein [Microcoleus sp. FACHB-45]